ncbi:thioesterase II family protein [Nocardia sp. CC227C]|uniref:thioesterase II family protein n=1 Tax=Nocardia sp. CC227C TaxID=3044562 RepID=UPI00278BCA32|nr:alpha/beta fold hydrolase [Nocardia sp. CC227C]
MTIALDADSWMPYPPVGNAPMTLYCLPHAGSGASTYLPWRERLRADLEVVPLQPPGRETRAHERPHVHVDPLVDELLTAVGERWRTPFALFGHSMGALVAFELAHRLIETDRPRPERLILSGRRAPHRSAWDPFAHDASDAELLAFLRGLGGTPPTVLDDPGLRPALFRLMRADLGVDETYRHRPRPPLPIPITVLGGSADPQVPVDELDHWTDCGTAGVDIRVVPGDHFFVLSRRETVLGHIRECLTR